MGGGGIPIVSGLVSGFMGQQAADAQAGAMSDAASQAAAAQQAAANAQLQMGEKGLLSQLFMAQQAINQANRGTGLELAREARALQAIEPFRRIGYSAIPGLMNLYQGTLDQNLQAEVPPELAALFQQQTADQQRMLNRQLAQQGTLGSPIGASVMGDQMQRLGINQAVTGYQEGLKRAQLEDARKWDRAMQLTGMGANLGTAGYQQGAGTTGQLANLYSQLGQGLSSGLQATGRGYGGSIGNIGSMYGSLAPSMGEVAGSSYANWGRQLNNLAGMYMNQGNSWSPMASNDMMNMTASMSGIPGMGGTF